MILNGTRRAADLTEKLLAFSRKRKLRTTALDLHQTVREAIALLRRSIDRNIRIKTRFEAASGAINGDPTLLQNAFLNLAVNARDAMPEGGLLTFATRDVELGADDPANPDLPPGRYVEVTVRDTGVGMAPEVLEKVFEPFYTTKPVSKGTGLGLATVYGTVQEHHGAVQVQSRPGQGTTVRILLPRESRVLPAAPPPSDEVVRGEGLVLVVDDEELVRGMAEGQLRSLGYEVLLAADGAEALDLYREHGESIDVVLLDLVMPVLGGRETLQRLREMDPRARVVVSSGFDLEGAFDEVMDMGAISFLAKPYRQAALSQVVAAAITSRTT
jgi:two-component system cell cycle sensor histidine kinase/response regulator CckA